METFRDPVLAISYLETNPVDLVFLDINMPKINGISVAKIIDGKVSIIFTTAYAEYAVESYNVGAIDYLMKPISYDRFYRSIEKARNLFQVIQSENKFILVKSGNTSHRLPVSDIFYLEKDGNYCYYHTKGGRIMARESTAESLEKLPSQFMRVHKSYIVNIDHVSQFNQEAIVIQNFNIPIGESFRKTTHEKLHSSSE
jgi:DNA-binding LytR/AlgR family response regulator